MSEGSKEVAGGTDQEGSGWSSSRDQAGRRGPADGVQRASLCPQRHPGWDGPQRQPTRSASEETESKCRTAQSSRQTVTWGSREQCPQVLELLVLGMVRPPHDRIRCVVCRLEKTSG